MAKLSLTYRRQDSKHDVTAANIILEIIEKKMVHAIIILFYFIYDDFNFFFFLGTLRKRRSSIEYAPDEKLVNITLY